MRPTYPVTRDVVLVGGGHAHALVLRKWGMKPLPGARLTVITPDPTAPYTGMLPGFVAGHYARDELEIDMIRLARFAGARVVPARAIGLDRENRRVEVSGRPPVAYDVASINVGITAILPDLPGFAEHAVPAKPLGLFADRWQAYVTRVENGELAPRIAVIGCGIAGAELALAMHHRLRDRAPKIHILEERDALSGASPRARAKLNAALAEAGVDVIDGARVIEVHADRVETKKGPVPATFIVSAAGANPQNWIAQTGLEQDGGFLCVDRYLRSVSDKSIFAAGDCAHMTHAPREKAGVYAVRQAPYIHDNLRASLGAGRLREYRPQADYLKLVSIGRQSAVADWYGLAPSGDWLWGWKDRIDRKFMDQFEELPKMEEDRRVPAEAAKGVATLVAAQQLCGGCGAKVGAGELAAQLAALPRPARNDVARGAGDDAALLHHDGGFQTFTTDHFRSFADDWWTLARIAALHAMGDVWAMGGRPQAALSQLTLPRMAERPQAEMLREILDAAASTFAEAGADLVGGHTSLGAELTVGFSVTGLVERPVGLDGAQAGDRLILTKPIGTGTVLAAHMKWRAQGEDVSAALASMQRSPAAAAATLAGEAHAMTDVTGFGLAGHLLGLLDRADLGAELAEVPFLPGAEALSAKGHRSSLFAHNSARADAVKGGAGPQRDLLFDPQTAGGMLAAVPEGSDVLATLHDQGEPAWEIGRLVSGPVRIELA